MRKILPLVAVAAILGGCAIVVTPNETRFATVFDSGVAGNGQVIKENRALAAATALELSGPVAMQVQVGQAQSLEIEGDSNLVPLVHTEVRNGTLNVWVEGNLRTNGNLRIKYATPALNAVSRSGSGQLQIYGITAPSFQVSASGSGGTQLQGTSGMLDVRSSGSGSIDASQLLLGSANARVHGSGAVTLGTISGAQLAAEVHNSGSLRASGTVRQLRGKVYGSGGMNLSGLTAEAAELSAHGSGSIEAVVTKSVDAQTTSSGSINVRGNPPERRENGKNVRISA